MAATSVSPSRTAQSCRQSLDGGEGLGKSTVLERSTKTEHYVVKIGPSAEATNVADADSITSYCFGSHRKRLVSIVSCLLLLLLLLLFSTSSIVESVSQLASNPVIAFVTGNAGNKRHGLERVNFADAPFPSEVIMSSPDASEFATLSTHTLLGVAAFQPPGAPMHDWIVVPPFTKR